MTGLTKLLLLFVLVLFAVAAYGGEAAETTESETIVSSETTEVSESVQTVYIISITDDIDLGLAPFAERAVREANAAGAETIIFEIDTFGGRMDSMLNICRAIDDADVPTVAYCKYNALSAGALVALACDKIYVRSGSTIGAATPMIMTQESMEKAGEKIVSAARSMFRTWAQKKGHPVNIAEAMVDEEIEVIEVTIDGEKLYLTPGEIEIEENKRDGFDKGIEIGKTISARGKLLTLTSAEAVEYGFAEAQVESREDLLEKLNLSGARLVEIEINWSEQLVRFLTNPAVAGVLLMLGFLGLYMEFKIPGFGAPGIIGLACFALFFWSRNLVHLAEYPEMILFVIGLILLGVELFLIPGFGVAGILGILCVFASIIFAFMPAGISIPDPSMPWEWNMGWEGVEVLVWVLFGLMVTIPLIIKFLPSTPFLNRIILAAAEKSGEGFRVAAAEEKLYAVGDEGVVLTTLRPAGRVRIADRTVDVVALGDFIEEGENIRIHEISGNRVVVRKV